MQTRRPNRPRISRSCLTCGAEFMARQSRIDRGHDKYCSELCSTVAQRIALAHRAKVMMTCRQCGASFVSPRSKAEQGRKYCSHPCGIEANRVGLEVRFWRNVQKTDGCWAWAGCTTAFGYGILRPFAAHRYSWTLHVGPIPDGMLVLHKCDNPPCTRPDHLFLGTQMDNVRDMLAKGRKPRPSNTKLTPEILSVIRERVRNGESQTQLAREYGTTQSAVSVALRNKKRGG